MKQAGKLVTLPRRFVPCFLEDADGRSVTVREIRRRIACLTEHCNADSEQKRMLVQRAAFLGVLLETQECAAADSGNLDLGVYVQGINALVGVLKSLGIEKHIKHAGGLRAYLKEGDPK